MWIHTIDTYKHLPTEMISSVDWWTFGWFNWLGWRVGVAPSTIRRLTDVDTGFNRLQKFWCDKGRKIGLDIPDRLEETKKTIYFTLATSGNMAMEYNPQRSPNLSIFPPIWRITRGSCQVWVLPFPHRPCQIGVGRHGPCIIQLFVASTNGSSKFWLG